MMILRVWLLFFVHIFQTYSMWPFNSRKSCVLDVNWNLIHQNAPLLLRRSAHGYELASPDSVVKVGNYFLGHRLTGVIKIPYEEEIYAACPGYGNTLYGLKEPAQFATFKCLHRRNILRMDKQMFKSHLLKCTQPVATLIRKTDRCCGDGLGMEYEIGYSVTPESNPSVRNPQTYGLMWMKMNQPDAKRVPQEGKSGFYRVMTCCYDSQKVRTLYSVNILLGDKIAGAETRRERPPFIIGQSSLYPAHFDVHNIYKYPNQKKVLQKILGRRKSDSMLTKTFLTRGHLASEHDFLMGNWQASSFSYINLVPQWQSINRGHWYRLEKKLRRLADITKHNLVIASGTYGILTVEDDHNTTREIYLDPDRELLPVPAYLWKLVFSPKNNTCIAFVISNNPFEASRTEPFCQDICHEHNWPEDYIYEWRGRMFCCSADELRTVIPYIPKFACYGILDYIPEQTPNTVPFNFWFRTKNRFL
ncbi:uncharacterized protein LOC124359297 isoform X1 [Homalodisca vitripennis]|uniref:uncharacterized protein LOC124359297 isoform X1 n=1 Tax=Homalodisca vitripennis TaxID=197043 RepID=UPI001EEBC1AF|nr:uncharacterized protein LOC124359297 isoform X1 [Homalodisca vitripennis]